MSSIRFEAHARSWASGARWCTATCLLALVACSAVPDDPVAEASDSITNGSDDGADTAVVVVASGGLLDCTGTLISPSVVLTAAHCLSAGRTLSIRLGSDAHNPDRLISVAEAHGHPAFDPVTLDNDIAVLSLASPADGVTPMAVVAGDDALRAGESLRVVGFGRTGPITDEPTAGTRRSGSAMISMLSAERVTLVPAPSQPCSGDSGGPSFASDATGERLVAVTSEGDVDCTTQASATRVSSYAPFIAQWLDPSSDPPSAGGCSASPRGGASSAVVVSCAVVVAAARRRRKPAARASS